MQLLKVTLFKSGACTFAVYPAAMLYRTFLSDLFPQLTLKKKRNHLLKFSICFCTKWHLNQLNFKFCRSSFSILLLNVKMGWEQVPHRLDRTSSVSIHPVLSFSALTPTLTHPHSSTLPRAPVSPALSALWGICISNGANSHSTVQSVSRSHLPLVFEWKLQHTYRPSSSTSSSSSTTRFSCSPRTWQPRMLCPTF